VRKEAWARLIGDSLINEATEREKLCKKHQELAFHLLNFQVYSNCNFFASTKLGKENYEKVSNRFFNFYKSFFEYFRTGNRLLLRQVKHEYMAFNLNQRSLEDIEVQDLKRTNNKMRIAEMENQVDALILATKVLNQEVQAMGGKLEQEDRAVDLGGKQGLGAFFEGVKFDKFKTESKGASDDN
jgi:hypothetical protein